MLGKVMRRWKRVVPVVVALAGVRVKLVAAAGADSSGGVVDRITDAISGFFQAIVQGFEDIFHSLIQALEWPFRQISFIFDDLYTWSWNHLGPLGVVLFVFIVGMTGYVMIFWFRKDIQQIQDW